MNGASGPRPGRVLLCAMESGGIRSLSPVLSELQARGAEVAVLTSQRLLPLWEVASGAFPPVRFCDDVDSAAVERIVDELAPAAIISGAAMGVEKWISTIAKARGIPVIAVIDEWYGYRERFADASGGLTYLPDAIALPDERGRREALLEGIPEGVCVVTGSPSLAALAGRAAEFKRAAPPRPELLAGVTVPVVTFLSETMREDYGTPESGPGGEHIGYTQDSVLDEVKAVLRHLEPSFLVEKLHPSSAVEETTVQSEGPFRTVRTRTTGLWPLLWHSDAVIGMRSMGLLEAHMLGCATASFQPGLSTADRCTAARLGLIPGFREAGELRSWLADVLAARRTGLADRVRTLPTYAFAPADAAKQVVGIAEAAGVR